LISEAIFSFWILSPRHFRQRYSGGLRFESLSVKAGVEITTRQLAKCEWNFE
jgi:hypothetical protein